MKEKTAGGRERLKSNWCHTDSGGKNKYAMRVESESEGTRGKYRKRRSVCASVWRVVMEAPHFPFPHLHLPSPSPPHPLLQPPLTPSVP